MKICIDTVVFIDILKDEYPHTQEKFYKALGKGDILIMPVITVAELMPQFHGNRNELLTFLNDHRIKVMEVDLESALIASERWVKYLKKKQTRRCSSCMPLFPDVIKY